MSSQGFSESETAKALYDVLRDRVSSVGEFMRMLGLPEGDYMDLKERRVDEEENRYQMLRRWITKSGRFDSQSRDCLQKVKKEVNSGQRDRSLDDFFRPDLRKTLREGRELAIFLYSFIRHTPDDNFWNKFFRMKLRLDDSILENTNSDDKEEYKYQILIRWMKKAGLRSKAEVRQNLQQLGVELPREDDDIHHDGPVQAAGDAERATPEGDDPEPDLT